MAQTGTGAASASFKKELERHNLFLSHAGEDKALVRSLHEKLKKRQHSPFLDQERDSLPLGVYYPTEILDAVSECQVVVFVLSEHFVTKKWPMLELVTAWKHELEHGRPKMFPVFYKLDVGEIDETNLSKWRKDAWERQASNDPDRVNCDEFEQALQALTEHSGVRKSGDLDDYRFAVTVVSEICKAVTPNKLWANDGMQNEEKICRTVGSLFKYREGKYRIVGMWGEPGSGKTWTAMAICRRFYKEFSGWVAFLDCSEKKNNLGMARALYLAISGEEMDRRIDNETAAGRRLEEFIEQRSLFVVLDSLPSTHQGKFVAQFALGILSKCVQCKVLITAHDQTLLNTLLQPHKPAAVVTTAPLLDKKGAAKLLLRLGCPTREWNTLTTEERKALYKVCRMQADEAQDKGFHPGLTKHLGLSIAKWCKESGDPASWPVSVNSVAGLIKQDLVNRWVSLQFPVQGPSQLPFLMDATIYASVSETRPNSPYFSRWKSIVSGCQLETVQRKIETESMQMESKNRTEDWNADDDDDYGGTDDSDHGSDGTDDDDDDDDDCSTDDVDEKDFMNVIVRFVVQNPGKWGWLLCTDKVVKLAWEEHAVEDMMKVAKQVRKVAVFDKGNIKDVGEVLDLTEYTKAVAMMVYRCPRLQWLNVEWNTRLRVLEVNGCGDLTTIEGLEYLTQLVCLRLVSIPAATIQTLRQINNLSRLQTLHISSVATASMSSREEPGLMSLQGCFKLRELIITGVNWQSLPEHWTGFSHLTSIDFHSNSGIISLQNRQQFVKKSNVCLRVAPVN